MSRSFLSHRFVALSTLLFFCVCAQAQFSITGTTCVVAGTQYQYVIAGNWTSSTTMTWSVTGGTINGSYTGTPLPRVYVTWTSGGGTVSVTTSNPNGSASLTV